MSRIRWYPEFSHRSNISPMNNEFRLNRASASFLTSTKNSESIHSEWMNLNEHTILCLSTIDIVEYTWCWYSRDSLAQRHIARHHKPFCHLPKTLTQNHAPHRKTEYRCNYSEQKTFRSKLSIIIFIMFLNTFGVEIFSWARIPPFCFVWYCLLLSCETRISQPYMPTRPTGSTGPPNDSTKILIIECRPKRPNMFYSIEIWNMKYCVGLALIVQRPLSEVKYIPYARRCICVCLICAFIGITHSHLHCSASSTCVNAV